MELGLRDKRVLVTGSTQGIGLATAKAFLREGAIVVINGRNEENLNQVYRLLSDEYGNRVYQFRADILSQKDLNEMSIFLEKQLGGLDILISNVGSGKPEDKNTLSVFEWERFSRINTTSTVGVLERIIPLLKKGNEPCVILISSIVAKESASAPVGYAMSKAAIRTLNKYLSRMWAKDKIRVNCVLPGNIYFEGGRWDELLKENKNEVERYIREEVPMERFGKPEEIADTILFLSSERSAFTTGAEVIVDGGQISTI